MPKKKKSRKVGQIGVRSVPKEERKKPTTQNQERQKKHKGKKPGNRQTEAMKSNTASSVKQQPSDPRVGSKKPIPLIVDNNNHTIIKRNEPKKRYHSPQQELDTIEADARLEDLLEKIDRNISISAEEQKYVDRMLKRHKTLCDMLGIQIEQEEPEEAPQDKEVDIYDLFEKSNLNDYK